MDQSIKALVAGALLGVCGLVFANVNVNTADARTLDRELTGVGKSTAAKIVAARKSGPFHDMQDLQKRVKGFGNKLVTKNQDKIRFKD
jgi:competence protein ComEA